jgi:hypothetical protein
MAVSGPEGYSYGLILNYQDDKLTLSLVRPQDRQELISPIVWVFTTELSFLTRGFEWPQTSKDGLVSIQPGTRPERMFHITIHAAARDTTVVVPRQSVAKFVEDALDQQVAALRGS